MIDRPQRALLLGCGIILIASVSLAFFFWTQYKTVWKDRESIQVDLKRSTDTNNDLVVAIESLEKQSAIMQNYKRYMMEARDDSLGASLDIYFGEKVKVYARNPILPPLPANYSYQLWSLHQDSIAHLGQLNMRTLDAGVMQGFRMPDLPLNAFLLSVTPTGRPIPIKDGKEVILSAKAATMIRGTIDYNPILP